MPDLSFTEVGEILRLLQAVEGSSVELAWGDLKIQVRRGDPDSSSVAVSPALPEPETEGPLRDVVGGDAARSQSEVPPDRQDEPPSSASEAGGEGVAGGVPGHWVAVVAPMAGTFYRSPKPQEPPFVEVGDVVSAGDTVALVEVMKLFTELKTETAGKVARVDAGDGDLVEFDQALVWIEPA